eukprot:1354457-Alexandrium_andersonii.AAC.1
MQAQGQAAAHWRPRSPPQSPLQKTELNAHGIALRGACPARAAGTARQVCEAGGGENTRG